ncbi:MAG: DNA primase [Planctomycetota bacterium JB042]
MQRVKDAVDLVDVASSYVKLTEKSGRFYALCPFHREKTPSFSVHRDGQFFHCFGCQKSGDVFTFVMELDRLTFPEALRQLAEQAGLELPERSRPRPGEKGRTRLYELLKRAASFYRGALGSGEGAAAVRYLAERGIDGELAASFGLGYAPGGWQALRDVLAKEGYQDDELVRAGVAKKNERGRTWDLLRERVVIPIEDVRGRVIAFGGRVLGDGEPKYMNSPETELFSKKTVLFGFRNARQAAVDAGEFLVVEGYMDVLAAHRHGVENVVGVLGTALTREHALQMKRYTERAVLLFDADEGGLRATLRSGPLLLAAGLDVAVVRLPPGLDPDEFLGEYGAEAFHDYLTEKREDLVDWLIRRARRRREDVGGSMAAVQGAREVLEAVAGVTDPLRIDLVVRRIADAFGLREDRLRAELRGSKGLGGADLEESRQPTRRRARLRGWEQDEMFVLRGVATDPEFAGRVARTLTEPDFRDGVRRRLFLVARQLVDEGRSPTPSVLQDRLGEDEAAHAALVEALGREVPDGEGPAAAIDRIVARRAEADYRRLREQLGRSGVLRNAEDENADRALEEVMRFHKARLSQRRRPDDETENEDGAVGTQESS